MNDRKMLRKIFSGEEMSTEQVIHETTKRFINTYIITLVIRKISRSDADGISKIS